MVADAADGEQAVRLAIETSPRAVVLDFDLPSLGGRELVEQLLAKTSASVFLLTPRRNRENTRLAMALYRLGVVAVHPKPEIPEEWTALGRTLTDVLLGLGKREGPIGRGTPLQIPEKPVSTHQLRYVAIGGSTGGPGAIYQVLSALEPPIRFGVAIVQHIAGGFEEVFSEWLSGELGMDIRVARHGEHLGVGKVRIAPAGHHLALDSKGGLCLDSTTGPIDGHRPAVDLLFRSLLAHSKDRVAAILLSGMGADGAAAMADLRASGVLTVAQSEVSCAVYGMPRVALETRAAAFSLAPEEIALLLTRGEVSSYE